MRERGPLFHEDKGEEIMYELIKKDGRAKRGRFHTVHGTIETPVFMNVGTAAAIKGAVSTDDLRGIKTQVELSNTYHLHVRPGDEVVKKMGRTSQIYELGQADSDRFGRISGVFSGRPSQDQRRRCAF